MKIGEVQPHNFRVMPANTQTCSSQYFSPLPGWSNYQLQ